MMPAVPRSSARLLAPLLLALALSGMYMLPWLALAVSGVQARDEPSLPPGGFVESSTSSTVRALPTATELAALLPARGPFVFPAPYNTAGIRLTNASDCGGIVDCVNFVGYSYWRNMNNSAGSNFLYAFVGLDRTRGGAGPSIFRYNKTTGETLNLGPLFPPQDDFSFGTGEGWYFSATQPTTLYVPSDRQLKRLDILTHASTVVFDISSRFGADKNIVQAHSSNDDRVHSFTLRLATTNAPLGCGVYREDTSQFSFFPVILGPASFDECQVDKSGQWLLIKEDVDGIDEEDNRIIDLATGAETVLLDAGGAGGHSDNGFGVMVAADNRNVLPNALRQWTFSAPPLAAGSIVYYDPQWVPQSMQHISFANARSAPLGQQYACGSAASRTNGARANEVACVRLDGSLATLVVAPVMTDLDAAGGGNLDYSKLPKGNLDPTGQYFLWTSNVMGSRLDAFIARVPSQLLVTPPSDITPPTVAVTAPAQSATVFGTVALTATAADANGVVGVQFMLDGATLGTELTVPAYSWNWNTTTTTDGVHALRAIARDAAGNTTTSVPISVTVLNTPGSPVISGVHAAVTTQSTAVAAWTTNQLADGQIEYGPTTAYGSTTTLDPGLVTVHWQVLAGLAQSTTYHYRITSKNAQSVAATSGDFTFTTAGPAAISGVGASAITTSSAVISWTTDLPASSAVEYGLTTGYGDATNVDPTVTTVHQQMIGGLAAGTMYHYRVLSVTGPGVPSVSGDFTFTTQSTEPGGPAPGGILESATSLTTRALLTPADLASFLPERGPFTFPAPYNTTGVRLTNAHDCGDWYDCVNVAGGASWRNMNNSAGSNFLYIVLGLDKTNAGVGPSLFRYNKTTGETLNLGSLFDPGDDRTWGNLDGWYFSPSLPTTFYIGLDKQLQRYDILTHVTSVVFDITSRFGDDKEVLHAQSSRDDRVHSFTLRLINNRQLLGCGVYREDTQQFSYFPGVGAFHECQVDQSGQWLLIKEDRDNTDGEDDRIVNLYTGAETVLLRTAGAAGPSDNGYGSMVALDATAPLHSIRTWLFGPLTPGPVVYHSVAEVPSSFTQVSFANARSAALDQQFACGGVANRGNGPRANEIACVRLDGSLTTLTLAPTMTDLDALGGGPNDDVIKQPLGTLDPTGNYFLWTTNLLGDRIDAFLVRVPSPLLVTPPADTTAPTVAVTEPADAATVSGTVGPTALASDDTAVVGVQFQLDGVNLGAEDTSAPYSLSWDTTTVPDGVHVLTAKARDAAGNFTVSLPATVTVLNSPSAPVITGVTATGIIERLATVQWHTDQLADSSVEYGPTTAYGHTTTVDPTLTASHLQTLAGLTPGTAYHFRVTSKNAQNASTTSADFTFTTQSAAVITAVGVSAIAESSATVSWTTDLASDTMVEYGPTTLYGDATNPDETFVTSHVQGVYNLQPGTTYHYRVYSVTPESVLSVSGDFTFTTGGMLVSGVGTSSVTNTSALVSWTSNLPGTSQVEYGPTTAYGSTTTLNPAYVTAHGETIAGLTLGSLYHYRVTSTSATALTATSGDFTVVTTGGVPAIISGVAATSLTPTSANIGWTTDKTASSQVEYGTTTAYGSATTLDPTLVTAHSQALTGLTLGTLYHYRVTSTTLIGLQTISADATFSTVGLPAISGVAASSITGTAVTIGWTTDQASSTQVQYGLTTAYGSTTTPDPTPVTTHSKSFGSLTAGATYHYRVISVNSFSLTGTSADFTFTTASVPIISGVAATALTGTTATIGWTTDQASSTQVEYGLTTTYGSTTTIDANLVTTHSQGLSGLTIGTLYHYRVKSQNSLSLLATSPDLTFTTVAPPVVSAVGASSLTGTTASIDWTTDQASNSQVEYGLTSFYGSTTTLTPALVTTHSQPLSGLFPGTPYHYRVRSINSAGLLTVSGDFAFTTVAAPAISGVATSSITGTAATIGWTTDQTSDSQVDYGPTTAYGTTTTLNPSLVTTHGQGLTGLTLGTAYHYRVRSTNSVALTSTSGDFTFTTVAAPAISAVASSAITDTAATIGWTTDQTASSQVDYGLTTAYGSTTTLDPTLVTAHSQTLTGLAGGTLYHYRVKSTNGAAVTGTSGDFTVTTFAVPVISAVASSAITGTAATIGWTTDQTASSQVEYGLTTAYGSTTTLDATLVTAHSQTLAGLSLGTLYHYRVKSTNGVALTTTSADFTFTTVAAPVISAVASSAVTGTAAAIGWTTDQTANSQVEYGTTTAYGSTTTLDPALVTTHSQTLAGLATGTLYHYRVKSTNTVGLLTTSADFSFTTAAPPVVSGVTASAITGTAATIGWTTDETASSQVEYGPTTAYGSTTTLDATLVTAHSQTLAGLSLGTLYHYRVKSTNGVALTTTSADFTFTTVAAPVISAVASSAVTGTAATIGWTTDQTASSQVEYGTTTAYGSTTTLDPTLVTTHSQALAGLANGTLYHYRVKSTNSVGVTATSGDFAVTTVALPVVSGVAASAITGTAATIGWTTDQTADSQVEYGLTTAYGSTTTLDATLVTTHSQNLTGLSVGTLYHYRVKSTNAVALTATSADFTFTTVAAPIISGVAASAITGTAATIGWTTDQTASSQVEYGPTTAYGSTTTLDPALVTTHSQNLAGLANGTLYHYRVTSTNSVGVTATSGDATFTTVAPPVISGVTASTVTGTSATIDWTTDQASDSQVEYGTTTAYGSSVTLDPTLVTAHSKAFGGLSMGTLYHYRVKSKNAFGLLSTSGDFTFTTAAPPVLGAIAASAVTGTTATIGWTSDQASTSQVEYGLTSTYGSTTTLGATLVTTHSQGLSGLSLGTLYHFRVKSMNALNLLTTSADFTFTTVAPPVISGVAASALTGTAATIGWTTDETADSQVEYGLTTAYGSTTTVDAALVTAHSQNLAGLATGTLYHYRVKSANSVALTTTSADFTFTTVAPAVISGVTASAITGTTATIGWTTDQTASSQVDYGTTTAYGSSTTFDATLVTTHSQGLSALATGTLYHYRVKSTNGVGLTTTSADATFTTVAPPVVSAVTSSAIAGTTATITWTTDETASSQVEYGTTTAYGSTTTLDPTLVTSHSQGLAGLTVGTLYHYRVASTNSVALTTTSADSTFTTVAPPAISGVVASPVTGTSATIGWTTDQASDSQVEYGTTTAYGSSATLDPALVTTHSQAFGGLTVGTPYHYRVKSKNSLGLLATSADFTFTTAAPPVISLVASSSLTGTAATIGWTTDQPATTQVEYGLTTTYGSATSLGATLVTTHSQTITGLANGTLYHYRVKSMNSLNLLATSADFTFTTVAPPVISAVAASNLTGTTATIGWTTDETADSLVEYGLTTAYGSTTTLDPTLVTTHSQGLSGLANGTLYHYRVTSKNAVGLQTTSADATFTTIAPPVINLADAYAITGTTAEIDWTTDQPSTSQVEYGLTTAYGSTTTLDPALVTAHDQNLTGLTPGTVYHYRVKSTNSVGLTTASVDYTFTTVAPPVISGIAASAVTGVSATIGWTTDQTTSSQVDYGTTTAYGSSTTLDPTLVTTHGQNVSGLANGTLYHYRVKSTNSVGLTTTSGDATFTTVAPPAISSVASSSVTGTSATITWTTDQTASSQVEYGFSSLYGSLTTLDPTLVTSHSQGFTGLITGTTYHYRVRSTNSVGLLTTSGDFTFTTVAVPVVSGVTVSAITDTTATISWNTDQSADTQIQYGPTTAYGTMTTLDATLATAHSQGLTGLAAGVTYHYRVRSTNIVGMLATSPDATFTTVAAPVISGVGATALTGTSATIGWTTDQPADSQVDYGLTTAYGSSTTLNASLVTTHSQSFTGLSIGTAYHFRVRSKNSLGMLTISPDFLFTTVAPPVVSAVAASGVTGTQATIDWTTDQTADSQVEYGLTSFYGSLTALNGSLVTSHSQNLTGLITGTTYHYRVRSTNAVALATVSGDFTFTTVAPPVISAVASSAITGTAATIGWTTDQTANSQVEYGPTTAYGTLTTLDATLVTTHSQNLTGLANGTLYHYRVRSRNSVNLLTTSGDFTFTTVAPPVVSAVAASSITGSAATIGWTTDQTASSLVEYGLTTAYGSTTTLDPTPVTTHSQSLGGLATGTLYHYRVTSTNSVSLTTTSGDFTFTTAAPPVISAVAASSVTGTAATIGWTTDQTANSQVEYGLTSLYGSLTSINPALVTTHSQGLTGLATGTLYHYRVRSTNGVSLTTTSGDFTFTTVAPPVVSAVSASGITGSSVTIGWTTNQPADSLVEYGATTAYGSATALDPTLVTTHGQSFIGLTPGTLYHYRVTSANSVALATTSGDFTFTTVAPPTISGVAASAITGTAATIGWTTNQAADSQVEYGTTTAYGSTTALDFTLVTTHGQALSGLAVGTLYHYRVTSKNSLDLATTSPDFTFTTVAPPVVSAIAASAITGASATIGWTTDQAANSWVEYGLTSNYGSFTAVDATLVTTHSQNLSGLANGTPYHYRVTSTNSVGLTTTSADNTFTTVAMPVVSAVAASSITGTAATVTWSTDQATSSRVEYGPTTTYGSFTTLDPTLVTPHSQGLSGLANGTLYHYRVISANSVAMTVMSGDNTFTTVAPPVVGGVTASSITGTGATIGWTTDQTATSQVEYGTTTTYGSLTTLDGTPVTTHSQALTGLANGTLYHYRVISTNGVALTTTTGDFTFTTVAAPAISGITASSVTGSSVTIGWTTNQAADSLVEYGTTTAYGSSTTLDTNLVTTHSQAFAGLANGTLYHYRVTSTNSFGLTTTSADQTVTTVAPPVLSNITATNITGTSATITWTTDQPADSQVEYGLTTALGSATTLDGNLVTSHSQTLTGLSIGTMYHYRVISTNSVGLTTMSADPTFTTVAMPVVSGVGASAVTGTSATIGWTTDQATTSQVEYGPTTIYGSLTTTDPTLLTSHAQAVTGLANGTPYHYRVISTNSVGLTKTSGDFTVTTVAVPVVSGMASSAITGSSATIGWTTDQPASSRVEYGPTTAYGSMTTIDPTLVTAHGQDLNGLSPGTNYHYRVISTNSVNLTATSGDDNFTTVALPVVSAVIASNLTGTAATIGWTTDQAASSRVEYGPTTAYGSMTTLDPTPVTTHSQVVGGLANGTLYHYRVISTNGVSLTATSADFTFTTVAVPVVSGVASSNLTGTDATIGWATDQSTSSQVEYGLTTVYGSATAVDPTPLTAHAQVLTGLANGTLYHYRVVSTNNVGLTATSADFTFTTVAVPVVSGVAAADITATTATIGWTTDQPATSRVEYGLSTAYGALTTLDSSLVTTHSQGLTGLTTNLTYHYRVISTNSVGLTATSADFTFVAVPIISGVTASGITGSAATIGWTTDQNASSLVEYGPTTAYGSTTTLDPTLQTAHSQVLTGLANGTLYHYRAISTNSAALTATSGDFTFTTVAPPAVSLVTVSAITGTAATAAWTTDQASDSQVEYGPTTAYGSATALDASPVTSHSQNLGSLTPATLYHYRVKSTNGVALTTWSADGTFTTVAPPVVSAVAASSVTPSSATVSWTTNQMADSQVEFGTTTAYGSTTALDPTPMTAHSQAFGGLGIGTTYHYRVISTNSVGLTTSSPDHTFATVGPPAISAVASSAITGSTATITWTTDQASDSQIEYGTTSTYGSATTLDATYTTAHGQGLTGLAPDTLYHYRVSSQNGYALTGVSADFTFTTVAPPVVGGVAVSSITGTTATVGWTTDQTASTQVEYGPTTAYGSLTTLNPSLVTSHSQGLTSLAIGTLYHYRVMSTNSFSLTTTSADFTFSTVAPPVVSGVTATGLTGATATINWTTDQSATSQVEYGPTTTYGSTTTLDATLVTSHSQGLSGLAPATLYHYRAVSQNSFSLPGVSTDLTFTTVAPPAMSGVGASSLTGTAATINWTTDQTATTQVQYGPTTTYGTLTTLDSSLVTSHSQNLTGLSIGTLYHYRVISTNGFALTATSADSTFATVALPVVSGVAATGLTGTTATVGWTTDQASTSQVEYGLTTAYGASTTLDSSYQTAHSQGLSGLAIGTPYHYRVISTNNVGLTTTTGDFTFSTVALPIVSGVGASSITTTTATIDWTTDQAATSRVEYGLSTSYGVLTAVNPSLVTTHSEGLTGLSTSLTYHYRVISTNGVGLTTTSADFTFVGVPIISGVTVSGVTGSAATVGWTTDQAANSQVEYGATTTYGSVTTLDPTLLTTHSQNLTGLANGTLYHYRVISTNSATLTATSADSTFTTVAVPNISGVSSSVITGSTATIDWSTDQSTNAQVEYGTTTAYGSTTTLDGTMQTSHNQGLTALTPGTSYHYRVKSANSVALLAVSSDFSFTTVANPVVSGITVSALTGVSATIGWTTDQLASTRIEYGPTTAYGTFTTLDPTPTTSHSQGLTGLANGTLYHYRVISTNSVSLTTTSTDQTFTTVAVPVVSGVAASSLTGVSATIGWTTNQAASSRVEYGLTTTYGSFTTLDATLVTTHSQNLSGLANGTPYHYRVISTNSVSLTATSADFTFTTVAPPTISAVTTSTLTGVSAHVTWTTNQTASSQINYGPTTTYGSSTTLDATLVTSHAQDLTGLTPGTTYHYQVASTNGVGLPGTSTDQTFTTVNFPVISAVAAGTLTNTSATVTWTTDQTADTQVEYGATTAYGTTTTLNATLVTSHSQLVSGLAAGTPYHYRVRSTNGVGMLTVSGDFTFVTTGASPLAWTSLVNVTATGGSLQKTAGCDGCPDAAAVSQQRIQSGDGYVELTASETTTVRWIGLSNTSSTTGGAEIQFALRFAAGFVEVRESNVYRTDVTYVTGDVFRIAVVGGEVRYSKNGVVFYTDIIAVTYPLLVDTSLESAGATLSNVVINGGSF